MAVPLCLIAAFALLPASQAAEFRIESWTPDTGLPIGSVNRVLQTRDGYLWMATFAGLVRYNGSTFQVFNTGNSKGLRTSRFVALFEDHEGALWAPTEGHGLTRYFHGEFTTYTTATGLLDTSVGDIFYDSEGRLIIDSAKGPLEWRDGRFLRGSGPSVADAGKLMQGRTASGATWYTDAAGLHRYEHGHVTVTVPLHLDMKRVYEDRGGALWIEYEKPGGERVLAVYRDGKLKNFTKADGMPQFRTFGAVEDGQGALWFGLRNNGGLVRIQNDRITRFTTADGLAHNEVSCPIVDREGTLWAPTDGGLTWVARQAIAGYTPADGLASQNVYPILQDRQGAIWIGTWPGLTRYEHGKFSPAAAGASIDLLSLFEDRAGRIWAGAWGPGLRYLNNGKLVVYPGTETAISVVRTMVQDASGDLWVGGSSGLARLHDGKIRTITARDGFPGREVHSLFVSRGGDLWIGLDSGAVRYRGGVFTSYAEAQGFVGKVVRSFYEDANGVLWLGTYDSGLFRFQNGAFTRYTIAEGLVDNGAFRIFEDGHGYFWLTCNRGIYRVARAELEAVAAGRARTVTSVPYGKRDGMPSAECNGGGQPAGIRAQDGKLWLPTQKGVAVIDPDTVPTNDVPPAVVIEQVSVEQRPMTIAGQVEILPGQSNLEIHYAALTYVRPDLTQFKYKLEGLDPDWIDAGNRRVAYFSRLPFGTYKFRVIAANRDRVWNREGAVVTLKVVPPFWRTAPFFLLSVGCLIALAALIVRRRTRRLQRDQALHDTFSRELITSQEKERKRIAAELHDSLSQTLSIIKHRAALSLQNGSKPETVREQMEEIAAAAGEALEEVREIVHDLRPVEIDRLGLTKALSAMVKKVSGSTDIRVAAEIDPVDGYFSSATEINIYRIVQEGLNNIVKHSEAADAAVRIRRDGAGVEITLRDNGKGFSPELAVNPDRRGSGLGLVNISERARFAGGKLQVHSAPGHGTTLTIRIGREESRGRE
jgi:signal transduction histidine kinase/ligand-binding sensor domain-containing protein